MQIGNLIASGDQIFDRKSTPANVLIEDIGAPIPLTKLEVIISGRPTISITAQDRIQAFAKLMMGGNGDTVLLNNIPIATGALKALECTITATNGAATTPAVFASSPAGEGRPYVAGEQTIQEDDRQSFRGFGYLIFEKANLDYANVVFPDGWNEKLTGIELDQYFAIGRPYVEGDGTLSGQTIVDGSQFNEITLFTTGGSITVLRVD